MADPAAKLIARDREGAEEDTRAELSDEEVVRTDLMGQFRSPGFRESGLTARYNKRVERTAKAVLARRRRYRLSWGRS